MKTKMEQFPANNPNPVLSVAKDGVILYSNEAGEPLLHEWGVEVGGKLPPISEFLFKGQFLAKGPEKIEVKIEEKSILGCVSPLARTKMRKHLRIRHK